MWTSLSAGAPVDDRCDESALDYNDVDNDDVDNDDMDDDDVDDDDVDDDDVDDNVSLFCPPSVVTSVSGKSLRTAPTSSELSRPLQLPIGVIACLTHNKLRHNLEFVKYVKMVDSLHALLNFRSSASTCESPLLSLIIFYIGFPSVYRGHTVFLDSPRQANTCHFSASTGRAPC
jgi:hypothetical protein